jgi:hypothetical protein
MTVAAQPVLSAEVESRQQLVGGVRSHGVVVDLARIVRALATQHGEGIGDGVGLDRVG